MIVITLTMQFMQIYVHIRPSLQGEMHIYLRRRTTKLREDYIINQSYYQIEQCKSIWIAKALFPLYLNKYSYK